MAAKKPRNPSQLEAFGEKGKAGYSYIPLPTTGNRLSKEKSEFWQQKEWAGIPRNKTGGLKSTLYFHMVLFWCSQSLKETRIKTRIQNTGFDFKAENWAR